MEILAYFEYVKLYNFLTRAFNVDSYDPDQDPASQFNADSDPQHCFLELVFAAVSVVNLDLYGSGSAG
jgi:hypothetical protein